MKRLLLIAILMTAALPAFGQENPGIKGKAPLDLPGRAVLYGGSVADLVTTRWAMRHGAVEGNPFAPSTLKGQVAMTASYAVGMDLLAHFASRDYPKIGRWTRFAFGGVKLFVTYHNIRVAQSQIRRGR